jgi:ABC-type oligopeptide transport system substrate-binding subunit
VAGYANPEVDALADASPRLVDPRDRLDAVQRALRLAAQERPYLPLYTSDDLYLVSTALRWRPSLAGEVRVAQMSLDPD